MEKLLSQLRARLSAAGNERDRAAIRRFFREQVDPYGVPSSLVHELVRFAMPEWRKAKPADRLQGAEDLFASGRYEEGMLAIYLLRNFGRDFGHPEWRVFQRWISRYVHNWAHCDGISMHLLGACLRNEPGLALRLRTWAASRNSWKRRASLASLVREAREGRHTALIADLVETLAEDPEPMVRKAVVWINRERGRYRSKSST